MSSEPSSSDIKSPQFADTACGARIKISTDAPYIHHQGEIVYFCSLNCKQLYDEDPMSSCMAARLLSGT